MLLVTAVQVRGVSPFPPKVPKKKRKRSDDENSRYYGYYFEEEEEECVDDDFYSDIERHDREKTFVSSFKNLQASQLADVLQILVSFRHSYPAGKFIELLQGSKQGQKLAQLLKQKQIESIMTVAVQNEHLSTVKYLADLPAAADLCPAAAGRMLQAATEHWWLGDNNNSPNAEAAGETLCQLPAVQSLEGDSLATILQAAAQRRRGSAFVLSHLCSLRGMDDVDEGTVASLLQLAVQNSSVQLTEALLQLPVVQSRSFQLQPTLQAAVLRGRDKVVETLLKIPAAQLLTGEMVAALVLARARLEHLAGWPMDGSSTSPIIKALAALPQAQQLTRLQLQHILQVAKPMHVGLLHQLLQFAGLQQLDTPVLSELFKIAAECPDLYHKEAVAVLQRLCENPSAQNVDVETVTAVLASLIRSSAEGGVPILCSLLAKMKPTAEQWVEVVQESLHQASLDRQRGYSDHDSTAKARNSRVLQQLLALPAVQALDSDRLVALLRTAIRCKDNAAIELLSQTAAAGHIPVDSVHSLLQEALRLHVGFVVPALCKIPGAQQLGPKAVGELLDRALRMEHYVLAAPALCDLPDAQMLEQSVVEDLLWHIVYEGEFSEIRWPKHIRQQGNPQHCILMLAQGHHWGREVVEKLLEVAAATGNNTATQYLVDMQLEGRVSGRACVEPLSLPRLADQQLGPVE